MVGTNALRAHGITLTSDCALASLTLYSLAVPLAPAGQVTDLDIKLVDSKGYPANIGRGGVRVTVTPQEWMSGGGPSAPPRGGKKSTKKDLSKQATRDPEITMPKFSLDLKIQGDQGASSLSGGAASANTVKGSQARKVAERAARIAKEGVALVVRAEATDLDIAGVSRASLCFFLRAALACVLYDTAVVVCCAVLMFALVLCYVLIP